MPTHTPASEDAETLALSALVWLLSDDRRADRLLALTGMTAQDLRAGIGSRAVLGAVLDFLAGHEPDLIAAAAELDVPPERLIAAREVLA